MTGQRAARDFFSDGYDAHRDLHSFPTRRSPDLGKLDLPQLLALLGSPNLSLRVFARSEEHTSELQSLAYLVCRLLLEKKNDIFRWPSQPVARAEASVVVAAHFRVRRVALGSVVF